MSFHATFDKALQSQRLSHAEALSLEGCNDLHALTGAASALRDRHFGNVITYSPKVFIPLTQLCRDVCHYCTFAQTPKKLDAPYLKPTQVLEIARAGAEAGCIEALFTLGDKPELRYPAAREALQEMGYASTTQYLAAMAELVWRETGLLPHLNPGVLSTDEFVALRTVSVSMGLMLESASWRLTEKGMPHYGSPDKDPAVRLAFLQRSGEHKVPVTSGILIGLGETRRERIESLLALRDVHEAWGNIQEVIVQNFRAKSGTKMHLAPEPSVEELQWTIAVARLVLGGRMSLQAPPNLSRDHMAELVEAGINDWGGVSTVTPDHVNPEAPWPEIVRLQEVTESTGKTLTARLPVYPAYIQELHNWVDPALHKAVFDHTDTFGFARDSHWCAGRGDKPPVEPFRGAPTVISSLSRLISRAQSGDTLLESEITRLFAARGREFNEVCQGADELRRELVGDAVSYVANRNINYTNICYYGCKFCAFSKSSGATSLRGKAYNLDLDEVVGRCREAWELGAGEVCLQGGIHPSYTGQTYLDITQGIKQALPDMHIHAFSALEVSQGAATLGLSLEDYLLELKQAGLDSLPGTAAEILDDEVRHQLCADKVNTNEWLQVIGTAHKIGLPTTATIMFGHIERAHHWSRHLLRIKELQRETGGFTEFVPLPYVHMEAPLYRRSGSRRGPTFREALLMHAVPRLVFHKDIPGIQASWVKLGPEGVRQCLDAGVNDLGGTLMNESISRAAGAAHGQEMSSAAMCELIVSAGRKPWQRTTLYNEVQSKQDLLPTVTLSG